MNGVAPFARANSWTLAVSSSSSRKNSEAPLWVCTAGRGLSVGSASTGISAGRWPRQ